MFNKEKSSEREIKKLNHLLLTHLEDALEIMTTTKCPYFKIDGFGSIYMDEKYIKRYGINIQQEEIDKAAKERNGIESNFNKNKFEELLKQISEDVTFIKDKITSQPIKEVKEKKENKKENPKPQVTLDDIIKKENEEINADDFDGEDLDEEPDPEITKEEALEHVKLGKRSKSWGLKKSRKQDKEED